MPALVIKTNVKVSDPKALILDFSKFAAQTLGKPEAYISVALTHDELLSFAGTFGPAFLLSVTSLDNLQPENTERYSKAFFTYFGEKLGVQDDRAFVVFNDPGRANIGFKSTTFQSLWGKKE